MSPRIPLLLGLAILSCLLALPAKAQLTETTLKGVLVDASGSAVGAASVVAKNESTGQARTATTDGNGEFVLAGLPPGVYTVSVSAAGFKSFPKKSSN